MFSRLLKLMVQVVLIFAIAALIPEVSAQQPVKPSESAPPSPPSSNSPAAVPRSLYATANDNEYREDFSDLTLKGSAFFPLRPVLGQKDDSPLLPFTRERWQLMWRPADPIDLYVCRPRVATDKLPVILYLYTSPSDTSRFNSDDWCMTMTSDGFAAVGFVSAYTGHRLEARPPTTTFFTNFQESLASTVHDVQMILDYLATRDDMDMNRVGMYGQGSGGTIAILASAVDKRIRALDVLTPWGDWPNFFASGQYSTADKRAKFQAPEFQSQIAPFDPVTLIPRVQARSVRIQDVRASGRVPDASQEKVEAAAPPTAIINQYGDMASLSANAPVGVLFGWLRAELQPNAKTTVTLAKTERVHYFPPESVNPMPPLVPWDELKKQEKEKQKAKEQQAPKDQQPPKDQKASKDQQAPKDQQP